MFDCVICGHRYNFRRDAWDVFALKASESYTENGKERIPYGLCNDCYRKHGHIPKITRRHEQEKAEREEFLDGYK